MKVHFMAAVDGDQSDYKRIVDLCKKLDYELVTTHYLERNLNDIVSESPAESELYVKKVQGWIKKADVVVFETTKPDVSVGYELALALNLLKPVIVLYHQGKGGSPHSLKGVDSDKLQVLGYDNTTLEEILSLALEYAKDTVDTRFNFFISPNHSNYLDWVAKTKKIPRSVYLRDLIDKDMQKNEEFFTH